MRKSKTKDYFNKSIYSTNKTKKTYERRNETIVQTLPLSLVLRACTP